MWLYRIIIFIILLAFSVFFFVNIENNQIFEGLFTETVGIILTLVIVDSVINIAKYKENKKINRFDSNNLLLKIRKVIIDNLVTNGFIELGVIGLDNLNTEKVEKKLQEKIKDNFLKNKILENDFNTNIDNCRKLLELNKKVFETIEVFLIKFNPYPATSIKEEVNERLDSIKADESILDIIEELFKKVDTNSNEDIKLLRDRYILTLMSNLNTDFESMLVLIDKIKKGKVFECI